MDLPSTTYDDPVKFVVKFYGLELDKLDLSTPAADLRSDCRGGGPPHVTFRVV